MKKPYMAFKISEKVYWVGAIDWTIRNFHGYATHSGTTYNAYLILSDKITLIDTVKAPFYEEMMYRISSVINPKDIDIIVSNHSEMDHSGCLFKTIDYVNPEWVYASPMGVQALQSHFHRNGISPIKSGETIDLGDDTLKVFETRMLHWPDSMISYLEGEKILFSQDIFGMHLASYERFDDQLDWRMLRNESAKYYANIITPFSAIVKKTLNQLDQLNLDIKMVATDHGPIWRTHFDKIKKLYEQWASLKPTDKAVVVYDTMWKSTEKMAEAIAEGIFYEGAKVKLIPLGVSHRSDIATEILEAGALIVGAPTINNQVYPTLADALTYLKGLKRLNLVGGTFGSYGWSGQSVNILTQWLEEMKVKIVTEPIKVKYVPTEEDLMKCFDMGRKIGSIISTKIPVS